MTSKRFYELLVEAATGSDPRRYSGRAMYGRQCIGIVVQDSGHSLVARVMCVAEGTEEREELADIFDNTSTDSMGYDSIMYWPKMKWTDDLETEDGQDEDDVDEDNEITLGIVACSKCNEKFKTTATHWTTCPKCRPL